MVEVSIVIVCMNNLKNLYPCLESIRKYTTTISYETLVVAYLFTPQNLKKVKADFPWVKFIESNEIRGFSENNNLALRQAKGKYCFILNDDTEMKMPVIDILVETIKKLPDEVAAISPRSVFGNGEIQSCGRPPHTLLTYILGSLKLWKEQKTNSPYINQKGFFQTYDLWGAFFLIKSDIFRRIGWFDERYFFSPEDIALSRKLNREGYKCYVNSDVTIVHYEGMTGKGISKLQVAAKPASFKGNIIYYGEDSKIKTFLVSLLFFFLLIPQLLFHIVKVLFNKEKERNTILSIGCWNCMKVCFSKKTPKQVFVKFSKGILSF